MIGRRLAGLLYQAGVQPRRNALIFFCGCAGMPHFDVLVSNLIGVVVTGRSLVVENNLLDLNRSTGISTGGAASVVRRNNVLNTGGSPGAGGRSA